MSEIYKYLGLRNVTVYDWIDKYGTLAPLHGAFLEIPHELFKQFSDDPSFRKRLGSTIFGVTCQQTA